MSKGIKNKKLKRRQQGAKRGKQKVKKDRKLREDKKVRKDKKELKDDTKKRDKTKTKEIKVKDNYIKKEIDRENS